ncbi:MAG: ABC transporter ATP-binding protein [Clostridia bacterium]|nr:ABC transporter ATP-binding protein [Clostridia bacterium]
MRKIFGSLREYKWPSILTLLLMVVEAFIETQIPTITANLVNTIENFEGLAGTATPQAMSGVISTGIKLVAMAAVSLLCGGLGGYACSKASAGLAKNLRHDMYARVQTFSFENIDKFSTSSLITRLTTDVTNVQMAYMMIIRTVVRSPMMMIFSIIMAYRLGGKLSLFFVVIVPVLVTGLALIGKTVFPAFKRVFKRYDRLNESIEENVRGMRVVKGFAREGHEIEKFNKEADSIRKDFTFAERVVALNAPLMQLCMNFNMVFILFVGAKLIVQNGGETIKVGQISAMLTYGMQTLMSLMMFSVIFVMVTISAESVRRISEVLKEDSSLVNPENPVSEVADGSVDFSGVSFRYSKDAETDSLSDINIHIDSGMTVGIIGGTGSGKSSLVQLIPRLYDVSAGEIKVGGLDVRKYDLEALRDSVAMVLQKNQIFSGTITENLRWGNPEATEEQIHEACRLAQADEFITSFPDGYDTYIEQGGTNVSGGQKQRLCIARALLKNPRILILDDSTSAVDTKTNSLIRRGFSDYIPETTKIIIAQRIASVKDADMIIVMDNGRITDYGTHEELLEKSEIYREVYEEQTNGGDFDEQ